MNPRVKYGHKMLIQEDVNTRQQSCEGISVGIYKWIPTGGSPTLKGPKRMIFHIHRNFSRPTREYLTQHGFQFILSLDKLKRTIVGIGYSSDVESGTERIFYEPIRIFEML